MLSVLVAPRISLCVTSQADAPLGFANSVISERRRASLGNCRATLLGQPTASKVDHAECLVGMVAGISDRQDATTRLPSHQHSRGSNIRSAAKSRYRGIDVAETALCASERNLRLAGISLGTVRRETFVIFSVRLAAAAALRESDQPASLVQERRKVDPKKVCLNNAGVRPPPVEPWLNTAKGTGPLPDGLKMTASRRTGLPPSTRSVCRNSDRPPSSLSD